MLQVELDNILPEEDALQKIKDIFDHVEQMKEVYVVTKGGRPVLAIVDIERLEQDRDGLQLQQPAEPAPLPVPPAQPAVVASQPVTMPIAPAPLAFVPEMPAPALQPLPEPAAPVFAAPVSAPPVVDSLPPMPEAEMPAPALQTSSLFADLAAGTPPPPPAPFPSAPPIMPTDAQATLTSAPGMNLASSLGHEPEDPSNGSPLA